MTAGGTAAGAYQNERGSGEREERHVDDWRQLRQGVAQLLMDALAGGLTSAWFSLLRGVLLITSCASGTSLHKMHSSSMLWKLELTMQKSVHKSIWLAAEPGVHAGTQYRFAPASTSSMDQ